MKGHSLFNKSLLILLGIIAFITLHGAIRYYVTSHVGLLAVVVVSLTIMVIVKLTIIKRRGLPHSVRSLFRRHFRH